MRMTKERAIEILTIDAERASFFEVAEAVDLAVDALKEQIDRKWIPCSERLPEEDGRFLVFLPDRKGTFMCADFLSGKWYPDDYECTSNHVIAWMPLPEPYKRGDPE